MNLAYSAYKSISSGLFVSLFPPFWLYSRIAGKYRESLHQRIGLYPQELISSVSGSPRIWIHAVSVGEVNVAVPIIESLQEMMPTASVILSTATEQGQALAKEKLDTAATCLYAPVDFIYSVRHTLKRFQPDILVCIETEIWPNWLIEANRAGAKTALINGRISVRSIRRYLKIVPLMREILRHVDAFSMIGKADTERILKMGAPENRIEINGNAKFDLLLLQTDPTVKADMMQRFNLNGKQPVFVAGSTRGPEAKIVLDVYEKIVRSFPEAILIIAPRHLKRAGQIGDEIRLRGLTCELMTELDGKAAPRSAPIVILDTIGELHSTYSIATVVFCGGSLVPLGGQNVFEAAVWGKPVLYGPSMEDFLDAKELLDKTGGGIQVQDGSDLADKALFCLNHPEKAERIGLRARKAVLSHQGAARKHAAVIRKLLD